MREIKFRGKRLDNGELVYGFYVYTHDRHRIIYEDYEGYYCEDEVDPATVGQYTGLKDKNGVKIYEGDVMHKEGYWGFYVGFEDGAFVKLWIEKVQRINWEHHRLKQKLLEGWGAIGNIHDNPKLLEVN